MHYLTPVILGSCKGFSTTHLLPTLTWPNATYDNSLLRSLCHLSQTFDQKIMQRYRKVQLAGKEGFVCGVGSISTGRTTRDGRYAINHLMDKSSQKPKNLMSQNKNSRYEDCLSLSVLVALLLFDALSSFLAGFLISFLNFELSSRFPH